MARGGKIRHADEESRATTLSSAEHQNKCPPAELHREAHPAANVSRPLLLTINMTSKHDDGNNLWVTQAFVLLSGWTGDSNTGFSQTCLV